ncbi:MAG: MMPL family protein [Candidatus Methanofastidiosum methylothiophilum]|uniref:MMPL family protein n=1 Tax=Candidatus Methanofastidiosum methylothiophilum TaxID=1705564 RepID=A0A150JB29_9EURY|nr:MAG: MMPL family protein [Candidatus Methanofastidiosum methylthiophilus]
MIELRDTLFGKLALFEYRYSKIIVTLMLLLTLFLSFGALNLRFESNFMKELPQNFDVVKTQNLIDSEFGQEEGIIILLETDLDIVKDIRNKQSLDSIYELEKRLKARPEILDVVGPGSIYYSIFKSIPSDEATLREVAKTMPGLISKDYTSALVIIRMSGVRGEEEIQAAIDIVEEETEKTQLYGLNYTITGSPVLNKTIIRVLREDSLKTMAISAIIVFILLTLILRWKSFFVIIPLLCGVFWTAGILSYVGIPISLVTASVGAIVIGLGAEYGIFMMARYNEEAKKGKTNEERIVAMVAGVGVGTIGSSSTTIAGFLALALSSMPMMVHLGTALSLGIVTCLIGALVFLPSIMALREW